jgi:hypothetical protein
MSTPYAGNPATFPANVNVVDDGDDVNATFDDQAGIDNADRTAYLKRVLPRMYSYAADPGYTVLYKSFTVSNDPSTTESVGGYVDITGCVVGDRIQVQCAFNYRQTVDNTQKFQVYLYAIDDQAGTPTPLQIPGSYNASLDGTSVDHLDYIYPMSLQGVHTVAVAGTTRLTFRFDDGTFGSATFDIVQAFSLIATKYSAL